MDDQNQTNQPTGQGFPPIVPSMPENITPSDVPVTTTTTTTVTSPQQTSAPEASTFPPVGTTPASIPTTEPFTMQTATPVEPEMPVNKPKNKLLSVIGGIAALLLVVGVAGAAYYVSNQLSTKQAVAPNAPTSKPAACVVEYANPLSGGGCPSGYDGCGVNCCNRCVDNGGGGDGDGSCAAVEAGVGTSHPACVGKNPGDAVCYQGMNLVCFRGTNTLCGADAGGSACVPSPTPSNPPGYVCPWGCDDTPCTESECGGGAGTSCPAGQYCCQPYTVEHCGGGPTDPPETPTESPTIPPTITPEVGACTLIKIYKKNQTTGNVDLLSQTDLQSLKVGDSLTFVVTGSIANLKGRFRVTKNGTAGEWLDGSRSVMGNESVVNYNNYIIETAGTYKFEARVSLAP